MENPYRMNINAFMEEHWKSELEANGFFPLRDCTEFVRIQDGNLMQIILCTGYVLLETKFYSQTLSEYMWCNYRSHTNAREYVENHYDYAFARYDETSHKVYYEENPDLQVAYALEILNDVHTPQDILAHHDKAEKAFPERPCLWYEAGDIEGTWKAIENSTCPTSYLYKEDVPPEKLKRDYWRSWKPLQAFAARDCLAKDSLQPLADFAKRSREFNMKYIQRYMPWLLK